MKQLGNSVLASVRQKRPGIPAGLAALALLALVGHAAAQTVDCGRLQTQIASSSGRGDPAAAARYAAAAGKQQAEIARTASYAQSIGCGNRQFLFFGSAPPPQCGGLEARIQQMRSNVASLQGQAQAASGEAQRRNLQAQFDSYCRGGSSGPRGLFDALFNRGQDRIQIPLDDERPAMPQRDEDDDRPRGGSQAVCVRTCDGGYFPMSYSARRSRIDDLEELCKALCPNVEAALYTYSPSGGIDSATSTSGEAYSSLQNAGKFRTKFDPKCTCKPANKSWVEALADAENLLGRRAKSEQPVTAERAEELSRSKTAPVAARAKVPGISVPTAEPLAPAIGGAPAKRTQSTEAGDQRSRVRVIDPKI